jgi:Protein of unknown function DUF262
MPNEVSESPVDEVLAVDDLLTEEGDAEVQPLRYAISSYGVDYDVEGLVRRIQKGDIYVPTFQRGFVWDIKLASRFIESLLLGLPVPGIFLSKESDTNKLLVVDGQQRLMSLRYFYEGVWQPTKVEFALKSVQAQFEGRSYKTLSEDDRRALDNSILHATVFKQDEPSQDESSVYEVFERLNSGGRQLTPQEIRSAVHHDSGFRQLLERLNATPNWREIYGPIDSRLRDQELILRFLALRFGRSDYAAPMVAFLNDFMGKHKNPPKDQELQMEASFKEAIALILRSVGRGAFRPVRTLNAAVFDSVMVGTSERLSRGDVTDGPTYRESYVALISNKTYLDYCARGTASEERVRQRLKMAIEAFNAVP